MSLIEVIISIFIASNLLLGMAMVHVRLINTMLATQSYMLASQQVSNLMEYLKIATKSEQAEVIADWESRTQNMLPQGLAMVVKNNTGYQFKIFWGSATETSCSYTLLEKQGCLYVSI